MFIYPWYDVIKKSHYLTCMIYPVIASTITISVFLELVCVDHG